MIGNRVTTRLIVAIFSTLLEEAAIAVIVLWGLPQLGIQIPLAGLIAMMVVWLGVSNFTYRIGSRALRKKPMTGLPAMLGGRGKVVSPLAPEGLVKIKSELWAARSVDGTVDIGEEVTVIGQDGLKLVVRKRSHEDLKAAE